MAHILGFPDKALGLVSDFESFVRKRRHITCVNPASCPRDELTIQVLPLLAKFFDAVFQLPFRVAPAIRPHNFCTWPRQAPLVVRAIMCLGRPLRTRAVQMLVPVEGLWARGSLREGHRHSLRVRRRPEIRGCVSGRGVRTHIADPSAPIRHPSRRSVRRQSREMPGGSRPRCSSQTDHALRSAPSVSL
jgi:hypothetical protein